MTPNLALSQLTPLQSGAAFFVAVFAGLVIALALQLLLTHLSVALGFTEARGPRGGAGARRLAGRADRAVDLSALASASLALFFGAWLGLELSPTVDLAAGAVVGLVVWGLFSLTRLGLDASVVGSFMRRAKSGKRWSGGSTSESNAELAAAVRAELLEERRVRELTKQIRQTVDRLEQRFDPDELRGELETLLSRTEIEALVGDADWTAARLSNRRGGQAGSSRERGRGAVAETSARAASSNGAVHAAAALGRHQAAVSQAKADLYRERFGTYLGELDADAAEPVALKRELAGLLDDPREGWAALQDEFAGSKREAHLAVLTGRGASDARAESILGWAEAALKAFSGAAKSAAPGRDGASDKLRSYLAQVDQPALRYADLQDELEVLFDDPHAGGAALKARLEALDRDTLRALLADRGAASEGDAEELLGAIEGARDVVVARVNAVEAEVLRRMAQAKRRDGEAAAEARRAATTAAWWALGVAATSGVAALLGGVVAASTGAG